MLSRTAEYALRAAVCLGNHCDEPRTTAQISAATGTPPLYLSKVMRDLRRAGLVHSRPGLHGGSTLARPPEEITALEVINAVDPIQRIHVCPLGIETHQDLCPLHRRLDDTIAMVEKAFRDTTLDELLESPDGSLMCPFPGLPSCSSEGPACVATTLVRNGRSGAISPTSS